MKPFVTFTDHKLHPHHGQEFGDISFTIKMLAMDDAVFVGIAKSYEKKPIKPTDKKHMRCFNNSCINVRILLSMF